MIIYPNVINQKNTVVLNDGESIAVSVFGNEPVTFTTTNNVGEESQLGILENNSALYGPALENNTIITIYSRQAQIQYNYGIDPVNTWGLDTVDEMSGAGAVSTLTDTTAWTSEGTDDALTLADGANGQTKTIIYVAEADPGDSGILTPASFGNGTDITFSDVGDSVSLKYISGAWWVVSLNGATVG
jgi:hypothetical protein